MCHKIVLHYGFVRWKHRITQPTPMSDSPLLTPDMALSMAIISFQTSAVYKMHRDEAWLKAERIGKFVPLEDPEVVQKVQEIILAQGDGMLKYALSVLRRAHRIA